jgi:hypothetical protein
MPRHRTRVFEMMPAEKDKLIAFLDSEDRWCKDAEARDVEGNPVRYDDDAAVAWDITGALCRLFGWKRACVLFEQLDRHLHGRRQEATLHGTTELRSMAALQDYNDRQEMTHAMLVESLRALPVWRGTVGDANRT